MELDLIPVRRALLSVTDKSGLVEFARGLHELGVELLSTGGTAATLREAGLPVRDVAELTGVPEMLSGRVKTLHPRVHGGLLADRDRPEHRADLETHGIAPIDLAVINLYAFEATVARPGVSLKEATWASSPTPRAIPRCWRRCGRTSGACPVRWHSNWRARRSTARRPTTRPSPRGWTSAPPPTSRCGPTPGRSRRACISS
jgi:hypothetical protein